MTLLPVSIILLIIILSTNAFALRSAMGRGRRPITSRVEVIGSCITAAALLIVGHQLIAWTVITVLPWFILVIITAATIGFICSRVASFPWLPTNRPIRATTTTVTGAVITTLLAALLAA